MATILNSAELSSEAQMLYHFDLIHIYDIYASERGNIGEAGAMRNMHLSVKESLYKWTSLDGRILGKELARLNNLRSYSRFFMPDLRSHHQNYTLKA